MSWEAKSRLGVIERTVACMRFREHVEVILMSNRLYIPVGKTGRVEFDGKANSYYFAA